MAHGVVPPFAVEIREVAVTRRTEPTDRVGAYRIVGTVTRGGGGPCYGFAADDGSQLALYSAAGAVLVEGERMSVLVAPAPFRIDCGPGILVRLLGVDDTRSVD